MARPPGTLLAIETATARLSVALLRDGERLEERADEAPGHHAERLLPAIESLLADAGCPPDAVDAFAVSIGPGSFTSLRVGLATAKGLAFTSDAPIVPVPTLEALAEGARRSDDERPIAALLDARRGELYGAWFDPGPDGLHRCIPDGLFTPEELLGQLPPECRLVGEGAALVAEAAGAPARAEPAWPRASSVARLALRRLAEGFAPEPGLAPRYVRRAEAEAKRSGSAVEEPV